MGKYSKPKLVQVTWVDSCTQVGWLDIEAAYAEQTDTFTYGLLIHETTEQIVIAHSHDPGTSEYNGLISIPRAVIKKIKSFKY